MRSIAAGVMAALSVGVYVKAGGANGSSPDKASTEPRASFDQRFFFDPHWASFDERFAATRALPDLAASQSSDKEDRADSAIERLANERGLYDLAAADLPDVMESAPIDMPPPPSRTDDSAPSSTGDSNTTHPDSHTAVYDIAGHTVYLPDGRALEAHSGLGSRLDDARYVSARGRGPTPPNVYELTLREHLFHGVRALRLIPVGDGDMFGRDGILAHSYMLGPSGQSNGCVVFSKYTVFLQAYLRGEVDRLVVIDHLAGEPEHRTIAHRGRHFRES
jgi:hypothetical protein